MIAPTPNAERPPLTVARAVALLRAWADAIVADAHRAAHEQDAADAA